MLRFCIVFVLINCCSIAVADEPQPLEIQFVVIELSDEEVVEGDQESIPIFTEIETFSSEEWMDEVIRRRTEGYDVRVRRITVTAYESLPAHVEMFSEQSIGDDESDDGERDQAVFDISCLLRERDDGSYSLEFSIRDEDRDEVPWEHPLLDMSPTTSPSGTPPDVLETATTITARPNEWTCVGGSQTSSRDQIGDNQVRHQEIRTIVLLRVVE